MEAVSTALQMVDRFHFEFFCGFSKNGNGWSVWKNKKQSMRKRSFFVNMDENTM